MRALLNGAALVATLLSGAVAAAPCSDAARSARWQEPAANGYRDLDALTHYLGLLLWDRIPGAPLAITARRADELNTVILTLR